MLLKFSRLLIRPWLVVVVGVLRYHNNQEILHPTKQWRQSQKTISSISNTGSNPPPTCTMMVFTALGPSAKEPSNWLIARPLTSFHSFPDCPLTQPQCMIVILERFLNSGMHRFNARKLALPHSCFLFVEDSTECDRCLCQRFEERRVTDVGLTCTTDNSRILGQVPAISENPYKLASTIASEKRNGSYWTKYPNSTKYCFHSDTKPKAS